MFHKGGPIVADVELSDCGCICSLLEMHMMMDDMDSILL